MATKKIAELDAINAGTQLLDTNLDETSLNGAGSRKVTWLQRMTYIRAALGLGTVPGGLASRTYVTSRTTAIPNGTDTTVLVVTVPVGAQAASIIVTFLASMGAGGAVGQAESGIVKQYILQVRRAVGKNSTMSNSASVPGAGSQGGLLLTVAGGNALTNTIDDGGMVNGPTGAIGATQTWNIRVNISRAAGASDNHTCTVCAEVLNEFGGGVTVA